jgi:hypothetical protein
VGHWICSCANTAARTHDLQRQIIEWETSDGTTHELGGCIHSRTMAYYSRGVLQHGPHPFITTFRTSLRVESTQCWSLEVSGLRAVVWKIRGRLRCNMCSSVSRCGHTAAICSLENGEEEGDEDPEESYDRHLRCSQHTIDVGSTHSTYWMKSRASIGLHLSLESAPPAVSMLPCDCGSPVELSGMEDVLVFSYTASHAIQFPVGICARGHEVHWDGASQAIYRLSLKYGMQVLLSFTLYIIPCLAIVYESVMQVLDAVKYGSTFIGSYNMLKSSLNRSHEVGDFFSATIFQRGMWDFMSRMEKNYKNSFSCPHCGTLESAPVLIFDGTSLGYRRKFIPDAPDSGRTNIRRSGPTHSARMYISSRSTRSALSQFLSQYPASTSLTLELFVTLCPSLVPIIQHFSEATVLPPVLIIFLRDLSRDSSFPGGTVKQPASVSLWLQRIIYSPSRRIPPEFILDVASKHYASFAQLILVMGWKVIPEFMIPFIMRCIEILDSIVPWNAYEVVPSIHSDNETRGYFGSGLPIRRIYNEYDMPTRSNAVCNKLWGTHPALIPGIMLVCCPHGICLAFETMHSSESPESVFRILYSRIQDWSRKTIVYDAGCRLVEYILHREPNMVNYLNVFIDRLHYKNHTSCTSGYDMESYYMLADINSVVNEQFNSTLQHCKRMISYMNHSHFIVFMKWLIASKNDAKVHEYEANRTRGHCREKIKQLNKTINDLGGLSSGCLCVMCRDIS